jgi:hypothetical protein
VTVRFAIANVAAAVQECGKQFACAHRDEDGFDAQQAQPELLVDRVLEGAACVVRETALGAAVDEVEGLRVDHEDPDLAPLHHAVEVAGPGLVDAGVHAQPLAELRLRGGARRSGGKDGERHREN